ncbi:MAG: T9SS type A sorting domain-containing protein [Cruoricaptor ignavus]|nr:T9SS type A sorting domain-containing protein [Cruoricaptor ignavus]
MRKFFTVLGVAASFLLSAQNRLQNHGFEKATLEPWQAGPIASYTIPPTIVSGNAHEGSQSVQYVIPEGGSTAGFYQTVAIEKNTEYVLKFWYKSSSSRDESLSNYSYIFRIWSIMYKADGTPTYPLTSPNDPLRNNNKWLPLAENWTEHTVEFTSATDAETLAVAFRAYHSGTSQLDDVSLVKKSELSTQDVALAKRSLVKNTLVQDELFFVKKSDIQIINTNGQVVKTASANEGSVLDVSSLAKGIYFVTGITNGEKVVQKIIKK